MIDSKLLLKMMVIGGVGLLAAVLHSCVDNEQSADEPIQTLPMHQVALDNLDAFQSADEYPYVCTFPGHWQTMQGIMTVVVVAE